MPLVSGWLECSQSTLSHCKSLGNPTNLDQIPHGPRPFATKIAHKKIAHKKIAQMKIAQMKIAHNMTLEKYLTLFSTSSGLLVLLLFVSLLAFIAIMAAA